MPPLVSFIGNSEKDTTTLVSRIILSLKEQGYSVARATGTTEARSESAQVEEAFVTLVTPDKVRLQITGNNQDLTLLSLRFLRSADIVIAEGFENDPHIPKIHVSADGLDPVNKHFKRIIALVTDQHSTDNTHFHYDDSRKLVRFIEKRFLRSPRPEQTVLIVNNKKIPLNCFIQDILANTVAGFTDTLKKAADKKDIELYINRSGNTASIS